ncbi:hypothetical protein PsYK624_024630 [Phanerochaete sordida]|uniref:Uncharacterized protein n=1 Tax=Phanerochaete sordida TaxID=48140 RepID=A0A9P3L9W3_9APHY|nr:hypothetical protein PsYK624_024630 [Phanerochaete sordida]
MLYFVVVFIELLVSTIIWSRAPQYINIINPWSAALPSLLGSRLMLSMREGVLKNGCDGTYEVEGFADATGSIKYCIRAP